MLTNGDVFYEAELAAIRAATSHICLEAYIFQKGEIASRFIEALTERARAGVKVRIVLDAIGSFNTWRRDFRELIAAGGEVCWYMPFRWYNLPRYQQSHASRTADRRRPVGFLGGAGIADHWYKTRGSRHTRGATPCSASRAGPSPACNRCSRKTGWNLRANCSTGPRYYPARPADGQRCRDGHQQHAVLRAGPRAARMLFQTLIASACRSIHLTTPYFLPDRSARRELIRAMRERGVELKIIVPGKHSDHLLTRRSSRRLYGDLLKHGAQIYEYQPSMIHTKSLVVDGVWSVVGSTNFDPRSFGMNDEINLAAQDEELAARLEQDFQARPGASRAASPTTNGAAARRSSASTSGSAGFWRGRNDAAAGGHLQRSQVPRHGRARQPGADRRRAARSGCGRHRAAGSAGAPGGGHLARNWGCRSCIGENRKHRGYGVRQCGAEPLPDPRRCATTI